MLNSFCSSVKCLSAGVTRKVPGYQALAKLAPSNGAGCVCVSTLICMYLSVCAHGCTHEWARVTVVKEVYQCRL